MSRECLWLFLAQWLPAFPSWLLLLAVCRKSSTTTRRECSPEKMMLKVSRVVSSNSWRIPRSVAHLAAPPGTASGRSCRSEKRYGKSRTSTEKCLRRRKLNLLFAGRLTTIRVFHAAIKKENYDDAISFAQHLDRRLLCRWSRYWSRFGKLSASHRNREMDSAQPEAIDTRRLRSAA